MSTPINILLVEDSADDAAMVVDELKAADFDPTWTRVETKGDFLAELEKSPDIIISDYRLPEFSGLKAVELLSQSGRDIPLILISGTVGEDAAVEAMKLGVTDYLLKDRMGRLGSAVNRALEQKRLRDEGRRAEQQIRIQASALEAAANAILITDTKGKILSANTAACSLTGYAANEMIGRNPRFLKSGQHDHDFYQKLWETILSGQVWTGEMANRRKDETIYHEEMTITPVRDDGGKITHFIAIKQDITERKRAERVLRDLSAKAADRGGHKIAGELAVIFVISALVVGLLSYTDVLQSAAEKFVLHYQNHFDDVFSVAGVLFLAFAAFAYRRWKEVKSEASQQTHVEEALRALHDELEKRIQQRTVDLVRVNDALRAEVAERKRAEEALKLFRILVDGSNDGIEVIEPETGRFLDINERTCQRLGYGREELLAMTVLDLDSVGVTPATWAKHVGEIRQSDFKTLEGRHRRKDGSTFPVEINVRCIKLDREYLIASVRDITERKRAEEALRESDELNRGVLNSMRAHIAVLDQDGTIIAVNDAWRQFAHENTGDTEGALRRTEPGTNYLAVCRQSRGETSLEAQPAHDGLLAVLRGEKNNFMIEYPCHGLDKKRWFILSATPLNTKKGGAVVAHLDISERKLVEQARWESEEKFRQLAENIQEVFWVTSPDFREIFYVSPAYEKIWGRTCASLYAAPLEWEGAIHPEDKNLVHKAMTGKLPSGEFNVEYRIIRPDKSVRWIRDRGFPVRNAQGEIYRIVGTAEDITEHRQLEEQFRQSQKMEAIGQLASGVAHDFNNILAVIQMQAALMGLGGNLSKEQAEHVEDIGSSVQRAAALTRQLLMFSRRQVMQARDLDLSESITNITKMLRRILGEDVQTQFKFAPQPIFIHADAGMLDQVLMNLVVNARDAMLQGGKLIIETTAVEFDAAAAAQTARGRPGTFACLSVSDTGCGIPPENLARIFEPFFTTKEVGKGTGLGLATVFGIVAQHQGWINVYSEVGYGTTFRIYLPRVKNKSGPESEWPEFAALRGGKEAILLAEDDAILRASVGKALAQLGYRVLVAGTGIEALEVWKQHHDEIRLLLTDMVMPGGMTGKDLGERLLKENPGLRVIYTSGYSAEVAGKDFPLEEGVNFLTKPYEAHKLAQTIRARLDEGAA